MASTFFIGFWDDVVYPILPNFGAVFEISPFLVGVILSANRFLRLFVNPSPGLLVDRIGTKTPFVVGTVAQGVATAGYAVGIVAPFPEGWSMFSRIPWGTSVAHSSFPRPLRSLPTSATTS